MSERDKIIAKIKESAYENVNKKLEKERKKVEDKVNNELVYVEKCLQYIGNKMVYKIVKGKYYTENYELADEKTFFEDYNKETDYVWQKGIQFFDLKSKPYEPLFKVNGESYYDMRYIIRNYEETFKDILEKINKYEDVKKSKKKIMIKWVVSICCVCAIAMIGIGVWKSGLIRISRFNPSDDQDSGLQETTEPAFQVVKKRPDAPIIWAEDLPYGPEYKDWNGKDVEGFLYDALVDEKNRGQ